MRLSCRAIATGLAALDDGWVEMTASIRCSTFLVLLLSFFVASCASGGGQPAGGERDASASQVFYAPPDKADVQLSPDGATISYLSLDSARLAIFVADAADISNARALPLPDGRSVYSYIWSARGDRLIYMSGARAEFDTQNTNGAGFVLYSLDIETGESMALTPPLNRRADYRTSADHPDKVFVSPSARDVRPRIVRISNIYTGDLQESEENDSLAPVYADASLTARFATHWADRLGFKLFRRAFVGDEWIENGSLSFGDRANFKFFGFDKKGSTAYYTHTVKRDRGALIALNLETGVEREIAFRDDAMVTEILQDVNSGAPVAWKFENQFSEWDAADNAYRGYFNRLQAMFDGDISIESRSADGKHWVISSVSDTQPKQYYLYDKGKALRLLFPESESLSAGSYAQSTPLSVETADGFLVTGYLTLPPGGRDDAARVRLPLVVWLHGGPWARMYPGFDPWSQWMAHQGYAALNVNFRGSIGFGKRFLEAHYGEWGGAMEDDIAALIDTAVTSGAVDPDRIAVMGESFGGYATMHFVADEPDIARCGVAISGLSDLNLFINTLTDYRDKISHPDDLAEFEARLDRERMQLAADERTETGRAALSSRSPIEIVSQVNAELLLAHGLRDQGVVPLHSEQFAMALNDRAAPVTYLTFEDEGHLIRKGDNWRAMMTVTEAFLAQCFGGVSLPIDTDKLLASTIAAPIGAGRIEGLQEALAKQDKGDTHE